MSNLQKSQSLCAAAFVVTTLVGLRVEAEALAGRRSIPKPHTIASLHRAGGNSMNGDQSIKPLMAKDVSELAAEAKIQQALEQNVSFQLVETPLSDFAERLRAEYGVPIRLDSKSLTDSGQTTDMPITAACSEVSLRSALDSILSQHEIDWILENESLVITSKAKAHETLETRVYPVIDLVLVRYEDGIDEDYDSLIELVTSTIEQSSWVDAGGVGSISPFPYSGAIVVSQTRRIHEKIGNLLENLRAARNRQKIPIVTPPPKSDRDSESPDDSASDSDTDAPESREESAPRVIWRTEPDRPAWRIPQLYR